MNSDEALKIVFPKLITETGVFEIGEKLPQYQIEPIMFYFYDSETINYPNLDQEKKEITFIPDGF